MRKIVYGIIGLLLTAPAFAQEPVVGVENPESLFVHEDPQLHANKQVALHIMRELLQCAWWDQADRWISERYIQHNPLAPSGREAVVSFFTSLNLPRAETCDELTTPIVAVLAEDDLVTVVWPMVCRHGDGEPYSSTWFDMWRIVDGKADQHWDPGMRLQTGCQPGNQL